ncbi:TetR/AcrR family transcriptional regulator, partial [Corynebacterium sp.]|uniref:TetR/AcrR family transcriptional regulator n=1 Tax=Corynebacterium sp. TaxID=1720 RepID=UPI003463355A
PGPRAGGHPVAETRRRPARERILTSATTLFYERGIAATGIDAVVEHAGVARKSLYNNFASKDELIAAFIERRHHQWLDLHQARLRAAGSTPAKQVLAVVDAYIDHAEADGTHFRGCGLLNSAAEFPLGSAPRAQVARHKQEVEDIVATALGSGDRASDRASDRATALHISFLLEGAMSRSGLDGTTTHLHHAREIIRALAA